MIFYRTFDKFGSFQVRFTRALLCSERLFKVMDYKPRIDCKAFEEEKDLLLFLFFILYTVFNFSIDYMV